MAVMAEKVDQLFSVLYDGSTVQILSKLKFTITVDAQFYFVFNTKLWEQFTSNNAFFNLCLIGGNIYVGIH